MFLSRYLEVVARLMEIPLDGAGEQQQQVSANASSAEDVMGMLRKNGKIVERSALLQTYANKTDFFKLKVKTKQARRHFFQVKFCRLQKIV